METTPPMVAEGETKKKCTMCTFALTFSVVVFFLVLMFTAYMKFSGPMFS